MTEPTLSRGRRVGLILSTAVLFVSGALGLFNGIRDISGTLTPLQRSVSIGVLIYGVAGLLGGMTLIARHPSSVWLSALWGIVVTYVSSFAAIAYAGSNATLGGAIGSGIGAALIALGVIWSAHRSTRANARAPVRDGGIRAIAVAAALLAGAGGLGSCRQLYSGPPIVTDRGSDGLVTKVVRAKRDPDRLIAQDLSVCWVLPEVYAGVRPGDHWRCAWRHVPEGQ